MPAEPEPRPEQKLPPVQMFWFGRPLNEIERLSITSFKSNGHDVHLYTYGSVEGVPEGVEQRDAGLVIPADEFDSLMAKGVKLAIFTDYFRSVLLRDRGGWWVDSDVVCLRPFDFGSEYVFGWQDERVIANGVMRVPRHAVAAEHLVSHCLHPTRLSPGDSPRRIAGKTKDALLGRRSLHSARWGATGPAALTSVVKRERLLQFAMASEVFYPVHWKHYEKLFEPGKLPLHDVSMGVHLWNGIRHSLKPKPGSPVRAWLDLYGL